MRRRSCAVVRHVQEFLSRGQGPGQEKRSKNTNTTPEETDLPFIQFYCAKVTTRGPSVEGGVVALRCLGRTEDLIFFSDSS